MITYDKCNKCNRKHYTYFLYKNPFIRIQDSKDEKPLKKAKFLNAYWSFLMDVIMCMTPKLKLALDTIQMNKNSVKTYWT